MHAAEMDPVRYDQPVNHWIKKGENELMLMLMPIDEEGGMGTFPNDARCELTLSVKQSGVSSDGHIVISSLRFGATESGYIGSNTPAGKLDSNNGFVPDKKGDVKIGETQKETFHDVGQIISRSITLPRIGLPAWKFYGSDDITDCSGVDIDGQMDPEAREALKAELLPIYRKIWSALNSGDVDEIIPMYKERSSETDAAFFKSPGDTDSRLIEVLKENVADPEKKLWPITDENTMVKVSDNNKLVALVQNNTKSLLCFDESGAEVAYYYDTIFRKKGKKWIIAR
jgi:hypothetical protein